MSTPTAAALRRRRQHLARRPVARAHRAPATSQELIDDAQRRRRHHQPDDLRRRALAKGDAYDDAGRRARRRGASVDDAVFEITTDDVRRRLRHLPPGLRRHRRRRRPRLDRGRPPTSPTTPTARSRRPSSCGPRSTARTCMIKIPATIEGLAAITETIARGHQRQRHADLQPRALPPRSSTPT